MNRFSSVLLIAIFLIFGCKGESEIEAEIANIKIDVDVKRFDREFDQATQDDIPNLKEKYPYLFPQQYADSVWVEKLADTLQIELRGEINKAFPSFEEEKNKLEVLFKHIKYYFPSRRLPTIITVPSDVEYRNRVILADSLLFIGLDNYLGEDHKFYEGIERYIAADLDRKYLASDVAGAFANSMLRYPNERTFLAKMIYYGKALYIKDRLIPSEQEALRIGYSQEEWDWAEVNEEQIWRYFIERELLYSTDAELEARFLMPAPFSKFRLELIDNESPDRLGRYIGWQIVRSFMEKNSISLQQLFNLSAEEIFKKSNYKPKK